MIRTNYTQARSRAVLRQHPHGATYYRRQALRFGWALVAAVGFILVNLWALHDTRQMLEHCEGARHAQIQH
jgi:hypothetical protein